MARQRWLVAVIGAGAISCAAGCKDKKKDEPGDPSKPAAATPGATAPKDKPVAQAQTDLQLIPVDAEAVLGINWAQLQTSSLWKKFVEPEMAKDNDFMATIAKFKDRCGFDPMTAVKEMAVGLKNLDGKQPEGVLVLHGLDKAKTLACTDKWQDEAAREKLTIKKDGEIVIMTNDDGEAGAFTFIGDDRMLVVIGSNATADGVKKAALGGSTLSTSPAFVDMYGKIKKTDSTWFLVNGNSKMFEDAAAFGIRPKAVFGSIHVTDGMSADVRARLDSPDQATQTVNNLKGQLQAMSSMVDRVEMVADGADVRLTGAASAQKLEALVKLIAGGGM